MRTCVSIPPTWAEQHIEPDLIVTETARWPEALNTYGAKPE